MEYLGVAVLGVGVLGVAVLGTAVLGTAVLHHPIAHSARPSLICQSIPKQQTQVHVAMSKDEIPWCGRAGRRRARDRRAAAPDEITLNTALVHAASSHRAANHRVAYIIPMVKGYGIPWCGRARGRCAGRRRARDRCAAPPNDFTLNTALVRAPPSHGASQTMESHRTSPAQGI